jgi:hypothetical protein
LPDEPDVTVFISYRRADTSADAGRLYDALRRRYGRDSVFMDVDSIRPGQDWVDAVEDAVGRCDALLALIGSEWSDVRDESGKRRLEDEFDRVRLEIEAALKSGKAVIPVLFEDAHMPAASELPESLRPLVRRNATRISHASFENDLRGLLRALRIIARAKMPPPPAVAAPVVASASSAAEAPAVAPAPHSTPEVPVVTPAPPPSAPPAQPARPAPPPAPLVGPPPPAPPAPVYYPAAQPTPPPAPAYYAPTQPYPGGSGSGRGGSSRMVLIGGAALVVVVLLGLLAWAFLNGQKPTPSPTPAPTSAPTLAPTFTPLPTEPPTPEPTPPLSLEPTLAPTLTPAASALDFTLVPTYGEANLSAGFEPDPFAQTITAGGSVDVSYLGDSCTGHAAAPPDFRVHYTAGSSSLLRFYFIADGDTTLIINDPSESWFCSDDVFGTLNPGIDYSQPAGGVYDIWVGSVSGEFIQGTLHVTELDSNHP